MCLKYDSVRSVRKLSFYNARSKNIRLFEDGNEERSRKKK